ncbi:hypothetical protein ABY63_25510 [Klebsiella pneumoniae]|uniref:hypothetical protein n=1 Tax=Klebsiella pneumoniae TaxID=573 RepID=UPI0004A030C6|nr:hypothetical protein ABY63_25510 [Klebsiella pneumoniae]KDI57818.1 hypothetical protein AE80_00558 [Klebsiella pneumoniae CHS 24]KLY89451.1 hypothetical protein SL05_05311 [Klebsiella pneumoniae]KMF09718.1 hypothetical protein SM19_00350 [Klebsiella pneumoniae]KMF15638.1 hypothetical protein SM22_04066 [Klebsiella pneumoniae]
MATTDTQQTAQFAAEAAVSAAEAKQYLIEVKQGYQDISATTQEAINAATAAEAAKAAAETAEQNSSVSAVASSESATAAAGSAAQAEEFANNASDYARNKFTFYKTASDPDGTIAGLAATTDGQSFWVAQGPDALSAAWQYQNKAGVAVLQAKQPGTAAVTGTIRVFPTTTAAQADADAGNILNGGKCFALNASENIIADEYTNTSGTLTPTGRKIASRKSVVIGCVDAWVNNNLYPFDSLSSPNENSVSMNVAAVSTITYREAYSALLSPVAAGDIITVRYKYSGTGGAPTIGLKTSLNGTFVSNQPTLTSSNDWQEVQLTATAATATLLAIGVNTRLATTVQLSIIAYASKKNAITTAILNSLDSISSLNGKVRIGSVDSWVNNTGYPFSTFSQVNNNRVNYANASGVYSEMYANINVPSGGTVTLSYLLNVTSGRLFVRLANGSNGTSEEVQLAGGGVRHTITLTATADTNNIKIYSKAEVSSGSIFAEVNYGQKNALTEQIDSLYSAIASANAILAILSQDSTFDSFVKSSPYTYTLSDAGTAYKQLLNTINAVSGASTVKMMYKISSANAALKIQSRNGNAWGANEKALTADGKYHEVDLQIASGQVFSGWGVYSQAKSGGYTADVTMIPISADGVFFTPATAILYGLMMSTASLDTRVTALENGQVTNQNTDVIFPAYFYAVDGRPLRFYGANMVSGPRPWRNNTDIVLSSHGYDGKSVLLKDADPDAMIMPSEINGPTLNINARADGSGNVFRKKAAFTKLAATQTGSVKVATIMDSLGERCVPWLYFALNATGATYVGAGSRTTRGMTDDGGYVLPNTPSAGIPFDGRGGWTTFDYIGKTQKTNFSQPFLRDAVAADFAAYPQYCYDKAYSGQSYADNPNLAGYHIFDVTAWMAASGVSASDKLVVVIQLGYNDLYYSYTPQQTVDAQEFMIAKFREKIANSRFVISHQAFGWSGVSAPQNWPDFAKWITQKIRKFDNRLSEKIIVAPAWAQLSYKYGMNETITATSDTGVQTVSLPDDVHPGELGGAQWGDALVAPVLAAWNW